MCNQKKLAQPANLLQVQCHMNEIKVTKSQYVTDYQRADMQSSSMNILACTKQLVLVLSVDFLAIPTNKPSS
jgi:hypothetical protein